MANIGHELSNPKHCNSLKFKGMCLDYKGQMQQIPLQYTYTKEKENKNLIKFSCQISNMQIASAELEKNLHFSMICMEHHASASLHFFNAYS